MDNHLDDAFVQSRAFAELAFGQEPSAKRFEISRQLRTILHSMGTGSPVLFNQRGILKQLRAVISSLHPSVAALLILKPPHSFPPFMPLMRVRRKTNPSLLLRPLVWLSSDRKETISALQAQALKCPRNARRWILRQRGPTEVLRK